METNSIWKRVSDWTVPVWKWVPVSIWRFPYRNGEQCHQAPHMEMGLVRFHMEMCLSPFPYGDHHLDTRGTHGHVKTTIPISIWGIPVWKRAGRHKYSHMGTPRFGMEFVPIWGLTYIYFEEYLTHNSPSIHDLYILIDQIRWAWAIFRRIIKSDITDRWTDRQTEWQMN